MKKYLTLLDLNKFNKFGLSTFTNYIMKFFVFVLALLINQGDNVYFSYFLFIYSCNIGIVYLFVEVIAVCASRYKLDKEFQINTILFISTFFITIISSFRHPIIELVPKGLLILIAFIFSLNVHIIYKTSCLFLEKVKLKEITNKTSFLYGLSSSFTYLIFISLILVSSKFNNEIFSFIFLGFAIVMPSYIGSLIIKKKPNKEYKRLLEKGKISFVYLIILPIIFSIFSIFISEIKFNLSIQFTNYSNIVFALMYIPNTIMTIIFKIIFINNKFFNFLKFVENKVFNKFLIGFSIMILVLFNSNLLSNINSYYSFFIFVFLLIVLQLAFVNARFILLKK